MSAPRQPGTPPPTAASQRADQDPFGGARFVWLGALLLLVLVAAAYHNSLHGPFILDDLDSIPQNPSIRHLNTAFSPPGGNGITVSGRPVLNASFALNRAVSGPGVTGFHIGNIIIHGLAAVVLFLVCRRTLGSHAVPETLRDRATALAWFISALWALHPLQTESVTYMVQRAESLVGLFYLFTLYAYIRATGTGGWHWRVAAVAACALGMGTKEVMATAPIIVLLYDRTFLSGSFREAWRRHGRLHLALFATLAWLAVLVVAERGRGGSVGVNAEISWWNYLCTQAVAIVRYARLAVWPSDLTLDYGVFVERNYAVIIPCGLLVTGAVAGTAWLIVRRPVAGFPAACFFAILAPSSSVIPVLTQTVAEHRMYLPLAAFSLGTVLAVRRWAPRCGWGILGFLVLVAVVLTVRRNETYQTARSIWEDTVAKNPRNSRALNNLGTIFLLEGKDPAAARPLFEEARRLAPQFPEASNNLGQTLVKLGKREEGLAMVAESLRLAPDNKRLHAGYGSALMDAGDYERAVEHLKIALSATPDSSSGHYNLGIALMKLWRLDEAEQHFLFTLEQEPNNVEVLNNYGTLLLRMRKPDDAIVYFERATREAPGSSKAYNNLGVAYAAKGMLDKSIGYFREALRLEPASLETRTNLAGAFARSGRTGEAIAETEIVLRRKPDPDLYNNLGGLYGAQGELDKAGDAFRAALALDPGHASARENLAKLEAFLEARRAP